MSRETILGCIRRHLSPASRDLQHRVRAEIGGRRWRMIHNRLAQRLQFVKKRAAAQRLLPGPVTVLLGNPAGRYAGACGGDPLTLGLRVPALGPALAALAEVPGPLLQSSANLSGGADFFLLQNCKNVWRQDAAAGNRPV